MELDDSIFKEIFTLSYGTRLSLIEARKAQGLSQQELAELLGTTQHSISRWEQGHTKPSPYFRAKLCKVFSKQSHELDLRQGKIKAI